MNSLVRLKVKHDLSTGLVLLGIPFVLGTIIIVTRASLLAIHQSPQAFGAQQGLHFLAPGGVIEAIEWFNAMRLL